MLTHIDRVQIVTGDPADVAERWRRLLGAAVVREDMVGALAAARTTLRAGVAEVELLAPEGPGPVQAFMDETGRGGLYAVGLATEDVDGVRERLESRGASVAAEAGQLFLDSGAVEGSGFRAVVTATEERERRGVMSRLFEVSFLVDDPETSARSIVEAFGLGPNFTQAVSADFGFEGIHVHLTGDQRDDIETITPVEMETPMGRFFARRGSSLYMCFGESDDMEQVRALAQEHAPDDWTGPRDGPATAGPIFLHPRALGGVMVGLRHA